jgi:hypothetical protein
MRMSDSLLCKEFSGDVSGAVCKLQEADEGEDGKRDLIPAGLATTKRAATLPTSLRVSNDLGEITPPNQFSGFALPDVRPGPRTLLNPR